jgi:hypothetical protein
MPGGFVGLGANRRHHFGAVFRMAFSQTWRYSKDARSRLPPTRVGRFQFGYGK